MYVQRTSETTSEASESPIRIHVLIDSRKGEITDSDLYIRGIMMPTSFAQQKTKTEKFPLSDTVCEELINLAVIFACRNVQDPRLATVVQTKSLEA